jgi:hypothetical protein
LNRIGLIASFALLAAACQQKQGASACVQGESNRCACAGGGVGVQVCDPSGAYFGACTCASICEGPAGCVATPDLTGLDLDAAGARLDQAGLLLPDPVDPQGFITVQQISDPPVQVLSQSPRAGQPAVPGSRMVLTVTIPPDQESLGLATSNFLVGHLQQDDEQSSDLYYEALDPGPFPSRSTLADWKAAVGFGTPADAEASAIYVTHTDLGFGRHMHMRRKGRHVAFYVDNYPTLDDAVAGSNFFATVAMEYGPAPGGSETDPFFTQFFVFNKKGQRVSDPILDDHGPKQQPAVCLGCHGGTVTDLTYASADLGAHFIPFDLDAEQFSNRPGYTRADQEGAFKRFNEAVELTWTDRQAGQFPPGDPAPVPQLIDGWYGGPSHPSPVFVGESFTPPGWDVSQQAHDLYHGVFAKTCQTCHAQREAFRNFSTYAKFQAEMPVIQQRIFLEGSMPLSEKGYLNFWLSRPSQPKQLAAWLGLASFQGPGKPIARLGVSPGGTVATGSTVTLDGSDSQYAQSFSFRQTAGAAVQLVSVTPNGSMVSFQPPSPGSYSFELTVSALGRTSTAVTASVSAASPPSAPQNATAAAQPTSILVSWTAPASDGSSPITGYVVTASPGNFTQTAGAAATQLNFTGLQPGLRYSFTVAAVNAIGTGPASAPTAQVRMPTVPVAPSGVTAVSPDTGGALSVSWSLADDGGIAVTQSTIKATPVGPGATVQATVAGAGTSGTIGGLVNKTAYTVTVSSTNGVGAGPDSAPSAQATPTGPPGAPASFTSSPASSTSELLQWAAPANDGGHAVTNYLVTWTPLPSGTTQNSGLLPASPTSFTVTGLSAGTSYNFTVAAINSAGTGIAATSAPPGTPVITSPAPNSNAGAASIFVSWTETGAIQTFTVQALLHNTATVAATATVPGTTFSTTLGGLSNCTSYDVRVTATNNAGSASATVSSVQPIQVPAAIGAITVTPGAGQFTATWAAPSSNGCAIDSYSVQVSGPSSAGTFSVGVPSFNLSGLATCLYTSNGTTSGQTCFSRTWSISVAAHNVAGFGASGSVGPIRPLVSYTGDNVVGIWTTVPSGACTGCHTAAAGNPLQLDGTSTNSFNSIHGNSPPVIQSPVDNSFLLSCPSNGAIAPCTPTPFTTHPGGFRFSTSSTEYTVIKQWILDGAPF